jgi:hypothetical protein
MAASAPRLDRGCAPPELAVAAPSQTSILDHCVGLSAAADFSAAQFVAPLPWTDAKPSQCYENTHRFVTEFGGQWVSGWALADYGPIRLSERTTRPLYCRWIHHLVWEDIHRRQWEVTPHFSICSVATRIAWLPTRFLVDRRTRPQINDDGSCQMLPARYVAISHEGQYVAECLNRLQHDRLEQVAFWLQCAMLSLQQAGFTALQWRVDQIDGRINNAWLFAES